MTWGSCPEEHKYIVEQRGTSDESKKKTCVDEKLLIPASESLEVI
jgi:hypothetical protein